MKTFRSSFFILVSCIVFLFSSCSSDEEVSLDSFDGRNHIVFILKDGIPYYQVLRDNRIVLDTSCLGFDLKDAPPLRGNFKMEQANLSGNRDRWEPVWGQRSRIRDQHGELLVTLKEQVKPYRKLVIEFRAFNDGVAFRYFVPEQPDLKKLEIIREVTGFRFREDMSAWWIPGDYDNHEFLYRNTPLSMIDSVNTPLTLESADSLFVSIHEASLVDYPEMRLKRSGDYPLDLLCDLVPWPDGVKAKVEVPFKSPWRTIQLASEAGKLIESTMILNLNEPTSLGDVSWIRPMKYVGIWWGMHIGKYTWVAGPKHGATTANTKRYIDFAAESGIPGVLIEGWNKGWENWVDGVEFDFQHAYDDYNLAELPSGRRNRPIRLLPCIRALGSMP
jgi:alpha-glucosidase